MTAHVFPALGPVYNRLCPPRPPTTHPTPSRRRISRPPSTCSPGWPSSTRRIPTSWPCWHATALMFKAVKKQRRREIRAAVADADKIVIAATATGAPDRIDDETRGIPISTSTSAPTAGTLQKARNCYICKQPYSLVDASTTSSARRVRR